MSENQRESSNLYFSTNTWVVIDDSLTQILQISWQIICGPEAFFHLKTALALMVMIQLCTLCLYTVHRALQKQHLTKENTLR